MTAKTKEKLQSAMKYCEREDKSTEFMLQYMQDEAGVDLNCVVSFLQKYHFKKATHEPKRTKDIRGSQCCG